MSKSKEFLEKLDNSPDYDDLEVLCANVIDELVRVEKERDKYKRHYRPPSTCVACGSETHERMWHECSK